MEVLQNVPVHLSGLSSSLQLDGQNGGIRRVLRKSREGVREIALNNSN
jgi:hypothetical protein